MHQMLMHIHYLYPHITVLIRNNFHLRAKISIVTFLFIAIAIAMVYE